MRNCHNCGTQCPENTVYCPSCGVALSMGMNNGSVQNGTMNPIENENYGGVQAQNKTNIWCILGLVFAFLFPILGLIFSIVGLSQVKKTGEKGKGLAITGIVLSILPLLLIGIIVAIGIYFSAAVFPSISDNLYLQTACVNVDEAGNYKSDDGTIVCENYVCEYEIDGVIKSGRCDD